MSESKQHKHVVLGITGSVAAYKAADIARLFVEKKYKVSVVMTGSAEEFIAPLTFSSLTGQKTYTDMFTDGDAWEMAHIELAKSADAILIAPATANSISTIACGLANDLLSCVVLATQAPVIIAPAMNTQMYKNKIFQENIAKLKNNNFIFVEPTEGLLACGDVGLGHIADNDTIVQTVINQLK